HQDTGRMQLVDAKLHKQTGHTGGYNIWGKDGEK
ncbi:HNH endonuclease, partial [Bacillus cereus]